MFCPKCKAEYKQGITMCVDCDVRLVEKLPPEPKEKVVYEKYYEVLSTYNPADVSLIKSILDEEKIEYYFRGENFMIVTPMVEPARLMVKRGQVARARELLKVLNLEIWSWNVHEED